MISICALISNSYAFGMYSNSDDLKKTFGNQNSIKQVYSKNIWTKDHSDLCQQICCASSDSDYEAIKKIIQNCHLDVDAHDIFGSTLLHQAAIKKDSRMLEALLNKNPRNINALNLLGLPALSCFLCSFYTYNSPVTEPEDFFTGSSSSTTKSSSIQKVVPTTSYIYMPKLRIRKNVDSINAKNCSNSKKIEEDRLIKPTYSRISNGSAKIIVEKFLAHGADIKIKDKFIGLTALHCATLYGDIETLLALINHDPSAVNELAFDDISPLDIAVDTKNIPIVSLLTKRGAKVKFENLQKALNYPELLKALLPYRNSLFNIKNGTKILIDYPFNFFNEEVISFLIDKNANVDSERKDQPSFLYRFAQRYSGNNNELIDKVIEASKHIDAQYDWGHTALSVAVLWKNFNIAKKLFKAGADPNIRDKIGFSARDLAKLYDFDLFEDYYGRKRQKITKFFV